MMPKPAWRWSYTWTKQNLSEMLKEIMEGTFHTNTENSSFSRSIDQKREVLIQCKERGLCNFSGQDCNAHLVPLQDIVIIPQPVIERKAH